MHALLLSALSVHAAQSSLAPSSATLRPENISIAPENFPIASSFARVLHAQPNDCAKSPNTHQVTDFAHFKGSGWPPLYLLGAQKAATTSLAGALIECGLVAFGMPFQRTDGKEMPYCSHNEPCKETLHPPIDITTSGGVKNFRNLHLDCDRLHEGGHTHSKAACYDGHFLEATPLMISGSPTVEQLLHAIPGEYSSKARFVLLLREPVSRMLSWYNHIIGDNGAKFQQEGASTYASFDNFYHFNRGGDYDTYKMGKYITWLEQFAADPSVSRSQLLVLSFNSLILDTAASMKNITAHYGLPQVLSNMNSLPEENSQDSPRKLVSIKCSTRNAAAAAYAPWNQKLYARLATDKGTGKAPSLEPHFPHFDPNAVDCGDRERSLSEYTAELDIRSWYERAHRRPPSAELLSNLLAPHEPVTAP